MNFYLAHPRITYSPENKDPHNQKYIYKWRYIDTDDSTLKIDTEYNAIKMPLECGVGYIFKQPEEKKISIILPIYPYDGDMCAFMDISYEWHVHTAENNYTTKNNIILDYRLPYIDIKTKLVYDYKTYNPGDIVSIHSTNEYIHGFKYNSNTNIWSTVWIDKEYPQDTEYPYYEYPTGR